MFHQPALWVATCTGWYDYPVPPGIFDFSFHLGSLAISPHVVLESLAYLVAFEVYRRQRRGQGDFLPASARSSVIVAAIVGAALGSKLLGWMEDPPDTLAHWRDPAYLMGGKTIVGALLGGTMAVEWTKARMGLVRRTGDLFAMPLVTGIAIGRIGCFLAGLRDRTFGTPTALPWGVDFGDGIRRHPTQLYEVAAMAVLGWLVWRLGRHAHREGDLFRAFLTLYLAWRLAVDFLKPEPRLAGLSAIQWCAAAALVWYWRDIAALLAPRNEAVAHG
jgi:phosphatidylglycerol---prolipoprotein diacylglyceryl transferase